MNINKKKIRYDLIDLIRGLTLISMILYHATWDIVYIYNIKWDWFKGQGAFIWQQCICWTFIIISGFSWSLGKKHLKRGLTVFLSGALISLATIIAMPENRVLFGVLTFLGSSMLIMILLDKIFKKIPSVIGMSLSFLLFIFTRDITSGFIGLGNFSISLPVSLYKGYFSTFWGFKFADFYSTDYFPIIPWIFLFIFGYFLFKFIHKYMDNKIWRLNFKPINFIGKHSLGIYIVHQPIIYAVLFVFFKIYQK